MLEKMGEKAKAAKGILEQLTTEEKNRALDMVAEGLLMDTEAILSANEKDMEEGRKKGYVTTLMGRRRELPEIKSSNFNTRSFGERVAMNMPIQGTAADIIKMAMVNVHKRLEEEGLKARLILQIHDELIIDTPFDEEQRVRKLLADCMQNVMKLKVPLIADVSSGHSWFDTK